LEAKGFYMADFFGHIAFLFIFSGVALLGKNKPLGFLVQGVGSLIWASIGFYLGMVSLVVWNLVLALVAVSGYFNLRPAQEKSDEHVEM